MKRELLFGLVALNMTPLVAVNKTSQPNIVVILVDDHAFEAISAYGSYLKDYAKTPNIDRLFHEGMRFDNLTCNNSICSPSRASIVTGQYSHTNGVVNLGGGINENSPQYPELLKKAGYQTWLIGKWHIESQPKGYQKYMIVKGQGTYFDPVFNGSEGHWERKGYCTDIYTDIAMDWLKERDHTKPFLLSLQYKAPHHDYGHAERYNNLFAGVTLPEPPTLYEDVRNSDSNLKRDFVNATNFHMLYGKGSMLGYYSRHKDDPAPDAMGACDPLNDHDIIRTAYQHQIHKYIRCITGNDDNVKRVLDYLDKEGLTENTIVIYTSDQGYWLGEHGLYDKRLILESSVRMPFLIRYPKMIKPESINNDLCMNVDIAPTLLDLAGVSIPETMQGHSFVTMQKGQKAPADWRKSQFYNYWDGVPHHYGIRTLRYTYFKIEGHKSELFDRQLDPNQLHNVADDPKYAETIDKLEVELQKQIISIGIHPDELPGKSCEPFQPFLPKKKSGKNQE